MKSEFAFKDIRQRPRGFWKAFMAYAGWIIGIASLLLGIYSGFIKKDEPKLEYDVVSATRFINDSETPANLKILIDSLDVQENHLNISAFNVKVENKGSAHIRYDDYDQGFFGLKIQNGHLLEPPSLVQASNKSIKGGFSKVDSLKSLTMVEVPTLSLDVDDYYIMRIVIIHNTDSIPKFTPEGKIIGQKAITLKTLENPAPGFWEIAFGGSFLVQIVRLFAYIGGVIILIVIIVAISSKIEDIQDKCKRENLLYEVSQLDGIAPFVKEEFIKSGGRGIEELNEVYNTKESALTTKYKKSMTFINSNRALESNNREAVMMHTRRYNKIKGLIDKGYLIIGADDAITYNTEAKESVQVIYKMLARDGLLRPYYEEIMYNHDDVFTGRPVIRRIPPQ